LLILPKNGFWRERFQFNPIAGFSRKFRIQQKVIMGNIQRPDYNASGNTNQWVLDVNRDWMRRIPDHCRLADISMPGTHNSCAGHGVVWVKCQSKCIIHQLRLGIRFLDIRCNNFTEGEHMYTGFGIFHGKFYQHISFGDVLID